MVQAVGVDDVLRVAGAIVVIGSAATVIGKFFVSPLLKFVRSASELIEDLRGRPARPGFDAVPGVLERLETIEHKVGRAEFHTGNGNPVSLRSVVETQGKRLEQMEKKLDEALAGRAPTTQKPRKPRTPPQRS